METDEVKQTFETGAQAPDFTLRDEQGTEWRLSDKRGQVVVLLFYPADETPVCTKQMCSLRDRWEDYLATGAEVVGISTDSVGSHRHFIERYKLPLRLLADTNNRVTKIYGAGSWIPGRAARAVVVIDKDGIIRYRKIERLALFRPDDDEVIRAISLAQSDK